MMGMCLKGALLVAGVFLIVGGAIGLYLWPGVFSSILEQQLALSEDSDSTKLWIEAPMKLTMLYHFFNLTNPEDITRPGKKLHFVEMGPYAFTKRIEKENITFDTENHTVTFTERGYYYFDPELSNGSLDDNITSLSVPSVMAAHKSVDWGFFMTKSLSYTIGKHSSITHVKTARELLFEGHEEPLFTLASYFPSDEYVPDKFGWLYEFNGTNNDDTFTMGTGDGDIENIGKLWKFRGEEETGYYEGECGRIKGSLGHMWPPKLKKDNITMFIESICRDVTLPFSGETEVNGIPAYRFTGDRHMMDNGTLDEANSCFCGPDGDECLPIGALNVSACHKGTPMVISYPHFYLADPFYTEKVSGMNPDPEKHSFYMSLEPTAGIPIDVRARTQVNIFLKPSSHIELYKNLQEVVFPIFWTEGRAVMTPKLSSLVHQMLMGNTWGFLGITVFLAIGVVLVLLAAVLHLWEKRRMSSRSAHAADIRDNGQVNKPLMGNSSIPHGNVAWTEMRPIVKPNVANGGAKY